MHRASVLIIMWIRDLCCKETNCFCWVTGDRLKEALVITLKRKVHKQLTCLSCSCLTFADLHSLCVPGDLGVKVFSLGFRGMLIKENTQEDQRIVLSCLGFLADPNLYLLSTICKYRNWMKICSICAKGDYNPNFNIFLKRHLVSPDKGTNWVALDNLLTEEPFRKVKLLDG